MSEQNENNQTKKMQDLAEQQTNEQPLPVLDAQQLMSLMKGTTKLTGPDILKDVLTNDKNIAMKANIKNPYAYALVHTNAEYIASRGFISSGDIDQTMINQTESRGVSKNGERVKLVLKAVESVLRQEFEERKMQMKGLMGR